MAERTKRTKQEQEWVDRELIYTIGEAVASLCDQSHLRLQADDVRMMVKNSRGRWPIAVTFKRGDF